MAQSAFRLDGQLALVTGGGTGLGLGISQALVEAGAQVVLVGRTEQTLQRACDQLGRAAAYVSHDVRDLPSLPGLVAQLEDRFGPLDILATMPGTT
jgi:NADP-dependent 3-hydroxy acid dehydrogenase YdfG